MAAQRGSLAWRTKQALGFSACMGLGKVIFLVFRNGWTRDVVSAAAWTFLIAVPIGFLMTYLLPSGPPAGQNSS
jgi:hypothetical protein